MKVLVLEDDAMARELIKSVLYSLTDTIEILEADTVAKGRALWQQHQPQLVLCDWTLADDSTGLQLVKYIRESDTTTPVLMISGHGDRDTVVASRKHGVTEFVIKPYNPLKLGERLKTYIDACQKAAAETDNEADNPPAALPELVSWLQDLHARLTPPPTLGGTRDIVKQLSSSEPPNGQDLAKRWRNNPAITTRLIHIANSGMLSRYGKKVNNLIDAINAMGVTMALQQALALSLHQRDQLSHPALAQHAILLCQEAEKIAASSATLAKQLSCNIAQSYTAGLLYPLGELALLQQMQQYVDQGGEINNAEVETLLGKLGWRYHQALQQLWDLPSELRERIAAARQLPDNLARHELILMTVAVDRVKGQTEGEEYQRRLGLLGLINAD